MKKIRIGTRGSRLALKQAEMVQEALETLDLRQMVQMQDDIDILASLDLRGAGLAKQGEGAGTLRTLLPEENRIETEIVILHTKGDQILDKPLSEIGEKGVFASEFEQALLEEKIDVAVHSAKDLPMSLADGLAIEAVLPRGDVRDVLVVPKEGRCPFLIQNACGEDGQSYGRDEKRQFVIGTGSRRRQLQAGKLWGNVICENIRGNVDSRLRKLKEGGYDGIILAKAGLDRLGIGLDWEEQFDFYPLHPGAFLPAACQGIIAVEAKGDSPVAKLCGQITDPDTELCFQVEREVLSGLSADCSEAAAAWCRREEGSLVLDVMYAEARCTLACEAELTAGIRMAREAAVRLKHLQCPPGNGSENILNVI